MELPLFHRFLVPQVVGDEGVARVFVVVLRKLCVGVYRFAYLI